VSYAIGALGYGRRMKVSGPPVASVRYGDGLGAGDRPGSHAWSTGTTAMVAKTA